LDGKDIGSSVLQYQFLPATQASLALLIPPIPAGFTRTPSHAG
jgi:hypothetical protein